MTREEAIKWLKDHHSIDLNTKDDEAHRMAIKALEQETVSKEVYDSEYFARKQAEYELWKIKEQQSCEDAVSRKEVNKLYDEYRPRLATHVSEFGDKLKALPPVTPTRKVGKWVANHDESDDSHTIDCSCCNYTLVRVVNRNYTTEKALDCVKDMTKNFCPNCGCQMENDN